jgi:hypothetical protein
VAVRSAPLAAAVLLVRGSKVKVDLRARWWRWLASLRSFRILPPPRRCRPWPIVRVDGRPPESLLSMVGSGEAGWSGGGNSRAFGRSSSVLTSSLPSTLRPPGRIAVGLHSFGKRVGAPSRDERDAAWAEDSSREPPRPPRSPFPSATTGKRPPPRNHHPRGARVDGRRAASDGVGRGLPDATSASLWLLPRNRASQRGCRPTAWRGGSATAATVTRAPAASAIYETEPPD